MASHIPPIYHVPARASDRKTKLIRYNYNKSTHYGIIYNNHFITDPTQYFEDTMGILFAHDYRKISHKIKKFVKKMFTTDIDILKFMAFCSVKHDYVPSPDIYFVREVFDDFSLAQYITILNPYVFGTDQDDQVSAYDDLCQQIVEKTLAIMQE